MRYFWLVIVLFLFSCTPYKFIYTNYEPNNHTVLVAPIYIEDSFSVADLTKLHTAIDNWNKALNGTIILRVENDHYHFIEPSPHNKLILLQTTEKEANDHELYISLAYTRGREFNGGVGGNRIYFVMKRINNDDLVLIADHEIGHSLGADHQEYNGLMNPNFTRKNYQCIDQQTLLQVASYQHIDINKLKVVCYDQ